MTEEPYWLDEAYSSAITMTDTGIMSRNQSCIKITKVACEVLKNIKTGVDYGGGYGLFVRMMRDCGIDYYWYDKHCENLVARGFENDKRIKKDILTSFEVFEHLDNPIEDIKCMFEMSDTILFSTLIYGNDNEKFPQKIGGIMHFNTDNTWFFIQ